MIKIIISFVIGMYFGMILMGLLKSNSQIPEYNSKIGSEEVNGGNIGKGSTCKK